MKNGVFLGKKKMILMVGMLFLVVVAVTGGNPGLKSATLAPHSPKAGAPARPGSQVFSNGNEQPSVRFVQLTNTLGDFPWQGCEFPSLNLSGTLVAFQSDRDLVPGGNPSFNTEIFLMAVKSGKITQLTSNTSAIQNNPSLDGAGKIVAFASFSDLVPGENVDNNSDIFVMNTDGSGLRQLTHSVGGIFVGTGFLANCLPNIDRQGKKVVFQSTLDLIPGQNTDGFSEIFIVNTDGTGLRQLTSGPVPSMSACFDDSGKRIIFVSDNNFTGENPDWHDELFMMNLMTNEIVQLSNVTGILYGLRVSGRPAIDSAMKKVVFAAEADLVPGNNLDRNGEIFMLDIESRQITQLTFTQGRRGCWDCSITASGKMVAFTSDQDLVPGSNADGNREIFLVLFECR